MPGLRWLREGSGFTGGARCLTTQNRDSGRVANRQGLLQSAAMKSGFLGFDSSLMLDVVVCALVLVVPVICWSLYLVKVRRQYELHAKVQTALAAVLLLVVAAFEIDMRMHGGWQQIVNKHPESPRVVGAALAQVETMLWIHLVFAVSTPVLWGITLILAWRRFPHPRMPSAHSPLHKKLGWAATLDLVLTSVTGLAFYWMAFVRS